MRVSALSRRPPGIQDTYQQESTVDNAVHFAQHSVQRALELVNNSGTKIKEEFTPNRDAVLWKGLVAGLAAGAVATGAMTLFQLGWARAKKQIEQNDQQKQTKQSGEQSHEDESSTVKVADKVTQTVLNRSLQSSEKEPASYIVHFAFGTLMGGLYGISSEYLPIAKLGFGLFHGLALWGVADASVLPALNLSAPVSQRSAGEISYEVLAHVVYGTSSEAVRRLIRREMD
jgi:putative membrane protein